jgi:hypothetical protein
MAEQALDDEETRPDDAAPDDAGPTPEGYTLDTYLLLAIIDALQGVQAAVIASAGGEPPGVKPVPRPVTAIDRLREERRLTSLQNLIDTFTSPQADAPKSAPTPSDIQPESA